MVAIAEVYFDETGTHAGSPVMGVAGYVFMKSKAKKFTSAWRTHLGSQGIPFFHMADCAPNPGNAHYKGWSTERRDKHERSLIALIKKTASFGFANCCSVEGLTNLRALEMPSVYDAYTIMLAVAANEACSHLRAVGFRGRAAFIFERGHAFQNQARGVIERLISANPELYFNASLAFVDKADAPPLQAADLLAWLARNSLMKTLAGKAVRRDFVALTAEKHGVHYLDEAALKNMFDVYAGRKADKGDGIRTIIARLPD